MTQKVLIYKRIEKWNCRPGVVAIATVLCKTEPDGPTEVDITSKREAIKITRSILDTLKIWEKYYSTILGEAPNEVREYLWNFDGTIHFPDSKPSWRVWKEQVDKLVKDYESLIICDYPGRAIQVTLTAIKRDINHYERLLNEFTNPEYYPEIP